MTFKKRILRRNENQDWRKKKIFGCREHIKKRVFKSFVAQWHCLFSFKKLNNSSNSPSPYVTIELSKRERERERVYWGSLKMGQQRWAGGECRTSKEKNDPLELRGKRILQSHGKVKLVWNMITNWFSLARPNCPWPMNDHTRVRWERSLDGLDWERESEEEKRIKRNKEGKRGERVKKEYFYKKY